MNKEIILLSNRSPLKQTCNHSKKNFQDHVYKSRESVEDTCKCVSYLSTG